MEGEAERAGQSELPTVIAELNLLIERYELSEAMIFGTIRKEKPGRPKTEMVPNFVNQVTGTTWTGRGQKPVRLSAVLEVGTMAENILVT